VTSGGTVAETAVVFRSALQSFGYEKGKNLTIDVREAKGRFALLPDLVEQVVELMSDVPDVIVTVGPSQLQPHRGPHRIMDALATAAPTCPRYRDRSTASRITSRRVNGIILSRSCSRRQRNARHGIWLEATFHLDRDA
jgi:hypothetical protein